MVEQAAPRIDSVGSSHLHFQHIDLGIFHVCLANGISLEVQWIPRDYNQQADILSRFTDKDDWSVNLSVFTSIDRVWGQHTFDRFASYYNAQGYFDNRRMAFWSFLAIFTFIFSKVKLFCEGKFYFA